MHFPACGSFSLTPNSILEGFLMSLILCFSVERAGTGGEWRGAAEDRNCDPHAALSALFRCHCAVWCHKGGVCPGRGARMGGECGPYSGISQSCSETLQPKSPVCPQPWESHRYWPIKTVLICQSLLSIWLPQPMHMQTEPPKDPIPSLTDVGSL